MTNELASVQQELRIAKQEAEIMSLKFQLEKVQAEKASRLEDSLFAPALFPHYQKIAETLSKSSVIPLAYRGKPEDIFVAMAMGYQLGFPVEQSLQDVAVINGRPCLWGDGLLSLVLNHPECKSIKEEPIYNGQVVIGYICTVIRKGHEPHSKSFTMQDAERAGLLNKGGVRKGDEPHSKSFTMQDAERSKKVGAWSTYPERMLQMRARSWALRDKFADALRGLRIAEIEQDDEKVIEGEIVNVTSPTSQVDKLKEQLLKGMPKNTILLNEEEKPMNNESKENVIGDKDKPISQDDLNKIEILMEEQCFDDARKLKALNYFRVEKLSDLSDAQAKVFLFQLQGMKK